MTTQTAVPPGRHLGRETRRLRELSILDPRIVRRAVIDALLKLDPAKIDRASVAEAFRNIKGLKTDVSCSPWYFGPGDERNAVHAGSVAEIKGDSFVTKRSCFEAVDPDLAGIVKMEKDLHLTD